MNRKSFLYVFLLPLTLTGQTRQDVAPLKYWPAPLYWQPAQGEAHANAAQADAVGTATPNTSLALGNNALVFVGMTPCRAVDTRTAAGFTGAFGPPSLVAGVTRSFPLQTSTTCSIPSIAQAYSLNVTVVPPGYLGFLTIWPFGAARPSASTLNDYLGTVVANAAIVPAGNDAGSGSVNVFVNDPTDLIIDINGYYAVPGDLQGNIALGTGTLAANTTGANNTASGDNALQNNTTGSFNTADGGNALKSNTTGIYNTASGWDTLASNTTGGANTAIGFDVLESNTTGIYNAAIGASALSSNTTGNNNTASGYQALQFNTTGSANTASGSNALLSNTTGSNNVASGINALYSNTSGGYNVASGFQALLNTNAGANTALGSSALQNSTTGTYNTAIGANAGVNVTTGSNTIEIGNPGYSSDSGVIRIGCTSNCGALGAGPQTTAFVAGIYGVTTSASNAVPVLIDSNGNLGTISSSRRYKEDIQDMGDTSSGLLRLRPVTFRYKHPYEDGSKPTQYGLIAEEVAEVYPDLVARSADGQIETVKYQVLDSMLLNELQKQNATITAQKDQIRSLEERLARVEAALERTSLTASSRQ
jgi:hypothetical protein